VNTTDLTAAIAALEDKKQAMTKRAESINDQIQLAVQHTRDLGEEHSKLIAMQSALQNAIDWASVAKFVVCTIEESRTADRKASLHMITGERQLK
jgi:hypothetical protein